MVNMGSLLGGAGAGATVTILINAVDNASGVLNDVNKSLMGFGAGITAMGVAGAGAIAGIVKQAGQFEQTKMAFTTMLGSEQEALTTLKNLADFAARTPFTIPGIENSARQLMAFGVESQDLIPTLKSVGDIAAGLGMREEGLQRLILNLGQVRAQGKLTGRELRDFAVAGIPLLEELAKKFNMTTAEVQEMVSAGEIGFQDVMDVFDGMTGEGGRFFNMMDVQSKTFLGVVSNIQDSFIKMARIMGEIFLPIATKVAQGLQKIVGWMEEHPKVVKFAAVLLGVGTALALIVGPLMMLIAAWPILGAMWGLFTTVALPAFIASMSAATSAVIAFVAANIWWIAVAALVVGALYYLWKETDLIQETFKLLWNVLKILLLPAFLLLKTTLEVIKFGFNAMMVVLKPVIDLITDLVRWVNSLFESLNKLTFGMFDTGKSKVNTFSDSVKDAVSATADLTKGIGGVSASSSKSSKSSGASSDYYSAQGTILGGFTNSQVAAKTLPVIRLNDFILSKGKLYQTHPDDTIVGTKNGKGQGLTVYINNLNGFNARDIAIELQDELKQTIRI